MLLAQEMCLSTASRITGHPSRKELHRKSLNIYNTSRLVRRNICSSYFQIQLSSVLVILCDLFLILKGREKASHNNILCKESFCNAFLFHHLSRHCGPDPLHLPLVASLSGASGGVQPLETVHISLEWSR
jgi:hypothetical protein